MKKSKLGLLFLSSLALVTGVASTGVAGVFAQSSSVLIARAAEEVGYTLTCEKNTTNTNYAGNYDVVCGDITWVAPGNQYETGAWRIGGKSITAVDRTLYTKTAIDFNVSSIDVTYGTNSLTVNSVRLDVYSSADLAAAGANGDVSSVSSSFEVNKTIKISRPSGTDWSGRFYRFTYNITTTATSNKYFQLSSIVFNKEKQVEANNALVSFDAKGGSSSLANSEVTKGGSLSSLPTATKDGYSFGGWYLDDGVFSTQLTTSTIIDSDVTVYAKWNSLSVTPISTLISSGVENSFYRISGLVTALTANNSYYIQNGNFGINIYDNASTGTILKKSYVGKTVTVTGKYNPSYNGKPELFNLVDLKETEDISVQSLSSLDDVNDSNHGRFIELSNVELGGHTTSSNRVTYSVVGSDVVFTTAGVSYTDGLETSNIYDFDNQFVNVKGVVSHYTNGSTDQLQVLITSISISDMAKFTIILDSDGGVLPVTEYTVVEGKTFTMPSTEKAGYIFDGWVDLDSSAVYQAGDVITPTGDMLLSAQWVLGELAETCSTEAKIGFHYSGSAGALVSTYMHDTTATSGTTTLLESESSKNASALGLASGFGCYSTKNSGNYAPNVSNAKNTISMPNTSSLTFTFTDLIVKAELVLEKEGYFSGIVSGGEYVVGDLISSTDGYTYEYNVNSNSITFSNDSGTQNVVKGVVLYYRDSSATSYSFNNVNLYFASTITNEAISQHGVYSSAGVLIYKGTNPSGLTQGMSYSEVTSLASASYFNIPVTKEQTVATKDGVRVEAFLTDIPQAAWKTELTGIAYYVVDGKTYFTKGKTYSVKTALQYYVENASTLGLTGDTLEVVKTFNDSIK